MGACLLVGVDDENPDSLGRAGEQGALPGLAPRRRRPAARRPEPLAQHLPVARVVLDAGPAHLDRLFDYAVTARDDAVTRPGVRVAVRFGSRETTGHVVERVAETDHTGPLTPIRRVVSAVPVLTPALWELIEAVAARYAGTRADVVRLAIPPRHATAERKVLGTPDPPGGGARAPAQPSASELRAWAPYTGGQAFIRRLAAGDSPRAAWNPLPWGAGAMAPAVGGNPTGERPGGGTPAGGNPTGGGEARGAPNPESNQPPAPRPPGWLEGIAAATTATLRSGRGVLIVAPDIRDVRRIEAALVPVLPPDQPISRLVAEDGPAARYSSFLEVLTGRARVAIGTRAAAFAPLLRPGLLVLWDDSASTHREPRAPYPHAREVLALRAAREGSALLVAAHGRTAETQQLVEAGWLRPLAAPRSAVRRETARVVAPSDADIAGTDVPGARIPTMVHRVLKDGLARGPVLVQVPRAGYIPAVACANCRAVARCRACHGPLELARAGAEARCGWCGKLEPEFECPECRGRTLRSVRVGSGRTAEELGRAFPGVRVVQSSARGDDGVVDAIGPEPALAVATPGAEPVAAGGYAAAALLDGRVTSGIGGLDAGVGALARWLGAAALVRPASAGGVVVLVGGPAPAQAQALVRWDAEGFAARDLADRRELELPPAVRLASVRGKADDVAAFVERIDLPSGAAVLGPLDHDGKSRALIRAPLAQGPALLKALRQAKAAWAAARQATAPIRLEVDPADLD
ncbi:MAG: primosomal protein N' [Bifidobacteriaceae bacterium]|nr:primosomal protein N' [Bifidobacteriaceae bacterium]